MKPIVYGIGAIGAVALFAYWTGRKHGRRAAETVQIGGATPSMRDAATFAVRQAEANKPLEGYRSAEGLEFFWRAPSDREEAYLKAAFWLAVASRVAQVPALAKDARATLAKTKGLSVLRSSNATELAPILTAAASQIAEKAPDSPDIKGILAALGQIGSRGAIQARQLVEESTSVRAQASEGLDKAASTADVLFDYAKGVLTGERPKSTGAVSWFFWKWGLRAAIGLGLYFGARTLLAPELAAMKSAVSGVASKVRQITTRAPAPGASA